MKTSGMIKHKKIQTENQKARRSILGGNAGIVEAVVIQNGPSSTKSSGRHHSIDMEALVGDPTNQEVDQGITLILNQYGRRSPCGELLSQSGKRGVLQHLISRVHAAECPPTSINYSGAIHALRVASSPYGDVTTGVGDVVGMGLNLLSIPEMGVEGVPIADLLKGSAGKCIRDPESHMLQDPMNWRAISDEVCKIKTYNDPRLRSKNFYLAFLKRLHDAGILSWTQRPRGRVGSFAVKKKPREVNCKMVDRQRLILDCRQVNTLFRAPPITELRSLPALGDLELPDGQQLFISGGDIKDCFYACKLPPSLRDYFLLLV